jgi:hypothetical protein
MTRVFKSIDNIFKADLLFREPWRVKGGMQLALIIIALTLVVGLIAMSFRHIAPVKEGFGSTNQCPDILIQKDKEIFLHNSRLAKIPGVNPIRFNNLEDYVEYVKWQRSQGLDCPVLYLQHTYDTQGQSVYRNRPSPLEKAGGLPVISGIDLYNSNNRSLLFDATRNNLPWNKNLYPGFDPDDQNIGLITPLDKMYHENPGGVSPNPMDANWGGPRYTQNLVDSGVYKEDNVKIFIPD